MISDVEICNKALIKIGQNTITSLTENNTTARTCNIIYSDSRDAVLRDHTWSFARKIISLNVLANEEVINWDYLYVYPPTCLFIIKIFNETDLDTNNYKELLSPITDTKVIASNLEEAYIEYIMKILNPNLFDSLFINALVHKLASELSMRITGNQTLSNNLLQTYSIVLSEAKKKDAQEKNIKVIKKSSYREAR